MWTILKGFLFSFKPIYLYISAAVLIALISFLTGHHIASNACKAEKLEAVERAIKQAEELQEEIDEIEREYLEENKEVREVYRYIDREVVKYVQSGSGDVQCFDAMMHACGQP